jgi:hypothetical protein
MESPGSLQYLPLFQERNCLVEAPGTFFQRLRAYYDKLFSMEKMETPGTFFEKFIKNTTQMTTEKSPKNSGNSKIISFEVFFSIQNESFLFQ